MCQISRYRKVERWRMIKREENFESIVVKYRTMGWSYQVKEDKQHEHESKEEGKIEDNYEWVRKKRRRIKGAENEMHHWCIYQGLSKPCGFHPSRIYVVLTTCGCFQCSWHKRIAVMTFPMAQGQISSSEGLARKPGLDNRKKNLEIFCSSIIRPIYWRLWEHCK